MVIRRFKRNGRNGAFLRVFDHFDERQKHRILASFSPAPGEVPLIAELRGDDVRLLLTDLRLISKTGSHEYCFRAVEIEDARLPIKKMIAKGSHKADTADIELKRRNGGYHVLTAENGPPLFGLLNAILCWINTTSRSAESCPDTITNDLQGADSGNVVGAAS